MKSMVVVEQVLADLKRNLQQELGPECDAARMQAALFAFAAGLSPAPAVSEANAPANPPPPQLSAELSASLSLPDGQGLSLLRHIVDYLPVAVSWFDADLNMLACNRLYKEMLGFPEELFASEFPNYAQFIYYNAQRGEYGPGEPGQITAQIVARARSQQSHVFERTRPDGTVLEIRGTPLPGGGFVTLYTDITEHKRAEQAALRNATYLRAVIAQLPQGLTVIDENLNIVLWNRLWESNCGARPGFLYDGVTFEAAVRHLAENGEYGGGDAAAIDEQVRHRVELAKQFQPHCFRRQRPNGKVIEIEGRTMDIEGKIAGFITMYNDITDRLAIDELKQAKESAEAANRMKSEFLALISHEIRTPLAGVIGMLKLALRDVRLQDETRELIVRGEESAHSLLAIINDLLDFSKIEAGKLTLENIDFALGETIQEVMHMFGAQAQARGLSLRAELGADVPDYLLGDPVRLRQILINLTGNALKFTQQGQVCLKVALARREHGINHLRFCVVDSGIGIAADAVARIFEKFEQADNATTRRFGGTGLGLAICRQLVELMGGTIGVRSTLGQGSEFYFELALPDGVATRDDAQNQALLPHTHRLRVLCADDFATNRIIIRMLVEEMGHQVEVVDSGEAALQAVAREHFDVILMDGRMPGMDGVTASRLIRQGGLPDAPVKDKEIYIIAVTANASEEDRKYYLQAGMDSFLPKPIDEANLHRQLARVITRQLQRGITLMPQTPCGNQELAAMFGELPLADQAVSPLADETQLPLSTASMQNDIMRQMRGAFIQDVRDKLALLEQALLNRCADESGRLIHSMRGSAVYLDHGGALQQLCHQLEPEADIGNWDLIENSMPQLRQLVANCDREAQT